MTNDEQPLKQKSFLWQFMGLLTVLLAIILFMLGWISLEYLLYGTEKHTMQQNSSLEQTVEAEYDDSNDGEFE